LAYSCRSHYGPGVDSASNRNEYQEYFLGGKSGSLNLLEPCGPVQSCSGTAFYSKAKLKAINIKLLRDCSFRGYATSWMKLSSTSFLFYPQLPDRLRGARSRHLMSTDGKSLGLKRMNGKWGCPLTSVLYRD
jgi:hypothetical protein